MRWERPVHRLVAPAWNRQPNTSASLRNAAVWGNRQKPSSTAGSWRKWPRLGTSSPRRPIRKALTCRSDRIASWRRALVPSAAIPEPFATRRRAISRAGRCSPCPGTPWRSDDSRPIAPCGKAPLRRSGSTRQRTCMFRYPSSAHLRPSRTLSRPVEPTRGLCDGGIASGTRAQGCPSSRPDVEPPPERPLAGVH
jgi:hypothetical protein